MTSKQKATSRFQDQTYLLESQYSTPENLEARITLHERFSTNPIGVHRWLLDITLPRVPGPARILELGCGQARLWIANADRVPTDWQLTLTDFSPGMIASSEANLAGLFENRKQFEIIDAQAIPFSDQTFDAVFAHFMLYHLPDRDSAYRHIRRVLKPGGLFFTAALGGGHLKKIYEMAMRLDDTPPDQWQLSFRLDNGGSELAPYFDDVTLFHYEDALRVTEEQPLVDYVLSMVRRGPLTAGRLPALRADIRARLERDGGIRIEKETGVFICRRPLNG